MKRFVVGIACLLVTACAGIPVPIPLPIPRASSEPKPASEVMDVAAVTPRDGAGAIVVTRDTGVRDEECTYDISLDGQLVAGLRTGEQVTIYADPGERIVGVSIGREGTCDPVNAQVPVEAIGHATKRVRVGATAGYDLKIESTSY